MQLTRWGGAEEPGAAGIPGAGGCALRAFLVCALLAAAAASAQDLEPRAYSYVPIGVDFLVVGYGYTQGLDRDRSGPADRGREARSVDLGAGLGTLVRPVGTRRQGRRDRALLAARGQRAGRRWNTVGLAWQIRRGGP
jgi:hypothetical protein